MYIFFKLYGFLLLLVGLEVEHIDIIYFTARFTIGKRLTLDVELVDNDFGELHDRTTTTTTTTTTSAPVTFAPAVDAKPLAEILVGSLA